MIQRGSYLYSQLCGETQDQPAASPETGIVPSCGCRSADDGGQKYVAVDGVVELVTPIPAKAAGGGKQPSVTAPAHGGEEEKKSNLSLSGNKLIRLETPLQCQTKTFQTQMVTTALVQYHYIPNTQAATRHVNSY